MKSLSALPLFILSALLGACGSEKQPELENPEDYQVSVAGGRTNYVEPTKFQEGIGLRAKARQQMVTVSAANESDREVTFLPQDFALITGDNPRTDFTRVTEETADIERVTPLLLEPGEMGSMRFTFLEARPFPGARLVYNNPRRDIQFFVEVE